MKSLSEAIIIGGGPCGSFTALNLAKLGAGVTVFEEHAEIGVPSYCTGHLSVKGLKQLGLHPLPPEIVENTFYGAVFHSPKGKDFSVRFSEPITCVVDRVLFDKHIAEMAENSGARYSLNAHVESLVVENGFVRGVTVKRNGKIEKNLAKIVVDAEGISSRFLRMAGLSTLNRGMLVNAVEAEVENVKDVELDMVEVFFGKDYAPGLYAWLIPKQNGNAKIGLATNRGNPKEFFKRLMLKHPVASKKLRTAKILRTAFHPIPLGGPTAKAYSTGFLAVGDAASHVKPTTGGGVVFGMSCAKIAAEVAYEALCKNDFSSEFLSTYQRRCNGILGFDMKVMLEIRCLLDAMSDENLDDIICFAKRLKLDKALQNVKDMDFQGQSLLRLLRSPRMLAALFYFFFLYLCANP